MQGPGPWAGRYTLPEQDERTLRIQGAAKRLFVSRHFKLKNPFTKTGSGQTLKEKVEG